MNTEGERGLVQAEGVEGEDKAEEVTDIESCLQQDMTPWRGHGYWQSAAVSLVFIFTSFYETC